MTGVRNAGEQTEAAQGPQSAVQAADAGWWDWDIGTGAIVWSSENYAFYDLEPDQGAPSYADWESRVHPDDLAHASAAVRDALAGTSSDLRSEFRVVHRNGTVVWLRKLGRIARDANGATVRLSDIQLDITALKRSEQAERVAQERLRVALTSARMVAWALDPATDTLVVSGNAADVFGLPPEASLPNSGHGFALVQPAEEALRILWPEPFCSEAVAIFRRTLQTGESHRAARLVEVRADIGDVESYDWKVERITLADGLPGLVCHFYDLSERQHFEELLRRSEERYRSLFDS